MEEGARLSLPPIALAVKDAKRAAKRAKGLLEKYRVVWHIDLVFHASRRYQTASLKMRLERS